MPVKRKSESCEHTNHTGHYDCQRAGRVWPGSGERLCKEHTISRERAESREIARAAERRRMKRLGITDQDIHETMPPRHGEG